MAEPSPTPQLQALIEQEPDLVDRIFTYLLEQFPQMRGEDIAEAKAAVREEFAGEGAYIARRPATERQQLAAQVLQRFNGRNASEVARELKISRASVYRLLKQPGGKKRLSFRGNETAQPVRSRGTPT
jgi:Mor family transcriptional regulator